MTDGHGPVPGAERAGYTAARRRPRLGTLALVALLHVLAIYGLARAFAPDFTGSVERQMLEAITVTVTTPPEELPEPEPEPDPGAAGEAGREATPRPVTAPEPPVQIQPPVPVPRASSTGAANTSGARETGEGTGAGGTGSGTGSGQGGGGTGGGAVNKPVHVSGSIDDARDYPVPEGGRSARRGTQVIVRVIVNPDGRASNCTIYRPSPDAEADRITCRLVQERLRFRPATDAAGNPVAAPFYWRQRWF
ncbi:TonB family protein [Pelagerythrobacter marensis]|uniref:Outer membrane transport energization protein TonB n=1 Tax=Pelagerythrobacter marensis TaxID=543877 RepID=A0A0G3X774_9SPHN|nr:TonB family protein [Pelagerythrobacter marensis]AKM06213.1 Outer membrane transport energization protein TonB [Pelagerythrobacter marensis]